MLRKQGMHSIGFKLSAVRIYSRVRPVFKPKKVDLPN